MMLIRINENLIHGCIIVVRAYRLAAYRQFIHWAYSRLGRGVYNVILSCVIAAVRHEFPEADGIFTGFNWLSCSLHLHYLYHKHLFP